MRHRYLAAGAALWAAVYCCGYVALIRAQGDRPVAWWYLALVLLGVVALSMCAVGIGNRSAAIVGFVILLTATILAVLSIGIFLLPAVLAAGFAMSSDRSLTRPT